MTVKFHQQHYVAIAECIRDSTTRDGLIYQMINMFVGDNPKFNKSTFIVYSHFQPEREPEPIAEDWRRYFDKDGRIVKPDEV